MTTVLGAGASLLIRAGVYALVALGIILLISAAAIAAPDVISAQPLPLPAEVPTVTLYRDGAILVAIVVIVALIVWRTTKFDAWVDRSAHLHGLAAALMEDELVKRGVIDRAKTQEPTLAPAPIDDDPAWAAEADRIAAPPPPAPRRVPPSTKAVAQTFSARRARGEKVQ